MTHHTPSPVLPLGAATAHPSSSRSRRGDFTPVVSTSTTETRPHRLQIQYDYRDRWIDIRKACEGRRDTRGIAEALDHINAATNAIFAIEQGRQ